MMSSEVIELSNRNSDKQISNADFSVSFPAITVNKGDVISMKSALISTIVQTPSSQLYFPEDVPLTFSFCYYDMDCYQEIYLNPIQNSVQNLNFQKHRNTGVNNSYKYYLLFGGQSNNLIKIGRAHV